MLLLNSIDVTSKLWRRKWLTFGTKKKGKNGSFFNCFERFLPNPTTPSCSPELDLPKTSRSRSTIFDPHKKTSQSRSTILDPQLDHDPRSPEMVMDDPQTATLVIWYKKNPWKFFNYFFLFKAEKLHAYKFFSIPNTFFWRHLIKIIIFWALLTLENETLVIVAFKK